MFCFMQISEQLIQSASFTKKLNRDKLLHVLELGFFPPLAVMK